MKPFAYGRQRERKNGKGEGEGEVVWRKFVLNESAKETHLLRLAKLEEIPFSFSISL
jgi:hypothetical protein